MFTLFMELGKNAGTAIKVGVEAYKTGQTSEAELKKVILQSLASWKPEHKGQILLTPALRLVLAQGFAGLAHNIGAAEAGRPVR